MRAISAKSTVQLAGLCLLSLETLHVNAGACILIKPRASSLAIILIIHDGSQSKSTQCSQTTAPHSSEYTQACVGRQCLAWRGIVLLRCLAWQCHTAEYVVFWYLTSQADYAAQTLLKPPCIPCCNSCAPMQGHQLWFGGCSQPYRPGHLHC
jgi:hypothetical protein